MLFPVPILAPAPSFDNGTRLYQSCRASVRLMDGTQASGPELEDPEFCRGYLSATTETYALFSGAGYCLPRSSTYGTLIRVYVRYMELHPKSLDEQRLGGLLDALLDAYPCPVKK